MCLLYVQGIDKSTGGLIVSDTILESAGAMREIPPGTFIFGSSANRDPHKVIGLSDYLQYNTPFADIPPDVRKVS